MFSAAVHTPNSPCLMVAHEMADQCRPALMAVVGLAARDLSDGELTKHIESCTYLMEEAYARYEASSCLSDRGEADRWRILRDEAIKSRSAAQVTRMERERGLA